MRSSLNSKKQKRVLIITNKAFPHPGGTESHVYHVCKRIAEDREDFQFVNLSFSSDSDQRKKINKNFLICLIKTRFLFNFYPLFTPFSFIKFQKEIKRFSPDIIHTHNRYMISTWAGIIYAKLNKIRCIHTEHAASSNDFNNIFLNSISWVLDRTIISFLLRRCDVVTGVSHSVQKFLRKDFKLEKVYFTPNYIDTKYINSLKLLNKKNINNGKNTILFAGRFVESKGYKIFLETVRRANPDEYQFLIVGDGPGKKLVQEYAKKYSDRLKYLGVLSHKGLLKLISVVDIFVNLSNLEGLSTTIMEAMYLKRDIVASDIAPNREILNGYRRTRLINPKSLPFRDIRKVFIDIKRKVNNYNLYTLENSVKSYMGAYSR